MHVGTTAKTVSGGSRWSGGDKSGGGCGRYRAPTQWVIGAGACTTCPGPGRLGPLPHRTGPVQSGAGLHCSMRLARLTSFHLIKSFLNT
jgi:hypothetical protein